MLKLTILNNPVSKAGLWYDHEQRRGGDIIELIKQEQGCDFIGARFAQPDGR